MREECVDKQGEARDKRAMGQHTEYSRSGPLNPANTAARLTAAREALGLKKSEIADQIGISRAHWSLFEGGKRTLSLEVAAKLCETYPLTMDYLVLGRVHTLPEEIARKIRPLLSA